MNRRQFIRMSGAAAAGLGFAGPVGRAVAYARPGYATPRAGTDKVVVALNLFGGNDGINTIVPLNEYDRYRALRPNLALDRDQLLPVAGAPDLGFNPSMTALRDLHALGKVAIVAGMGLPANAVGLFDHEASSYVFQSCDITRAAATTAPSGWLGRYIDSVEPGVITPAIDLVGNQLVISGLSSEALAISGAIEDFHIYSAFDSDSVLAAYADVQRIAATPGVAERNRRLRASALEQSEVVRQRTEGYAPAATYPADSYLAYSLMEAAQLITSDIGVRAIALGYGEFDTHAGQRDGGYHDNQLGELSDCLSAFYQDLDGHGDADRVVIVVFSEFGRRPEENTDGGTDHGFGSLGFVIGGAVNGGVYGTYPSLAEDRLVLDGNVDVTVDFRSVYSTVLGGFLDTDPVPILGGSFASLGFL
jgi:uncharacterized protein (DUF1501 family)